MPKSRNRKGHKKKVADRNRRIKDTLSKNERKQREYLMNLIEEEKKKGMFDNITVSNIEDGKSDINTPNTSPLDNLEGPSI